MKPMFILNRDEEIVAVLSGNADDPGCHFFNALLTLELNKGASLTFEVATTESDVVKYVKEENMVVVNDGENYRLLIIKEVSDIHEDSCMKEVYCEDASAELIDEIIYDEIKGKVEMGIALASILEGTRWELGEVDNTYLRSLKSEYKLRTVLNGIQTLANDYDAEIDFTVEFAGNKIVARKVHMKKAFGRTLGKRFEFGKDITSIKRTVNTADIKTAILPFGATNEETGEVLTIKDVSWSKPTNPFNKPLGQAYIEDEEATELWGYKGTGEKRRARWIAVTFEDCTDANELINYAQMQLNRFNKPKISYEAEVVDLYRMVEDESFSYEKVGLGDLVNIIDHEFVPALTLQSRVVKLELDLNDTSNSKVTLGTIVESIVDKDLKTQIEELNVKVSAVASSVDLSDIEDRLDKVESETGTGRWEQIQEVNNLLFSNAVGYHYMDSDNGIWVFDKPANENPTKAVALKGGMIGLAKYDEQLQEWKVGTFIDGNSVNASMITTGTLKADRIEAGALTVNHFNQELKTVINSVGNKADRTEVTTAIKTAVDEINLSVSTNYSTKSETSSAVANAKTEVKSYADTKKAEAIAKAVEDASAYADTKSDAVKNALTSLINDKASKTDVYTKSETYTKAQTDSAIKVAKDEINLGVSSTYETKEKVTTAIASAKTEAINSAVSTSKSYADTKKTEAITQAGKDADSKVSTAKADLQKNIDLKASKTDVYNKTETYTKTETDSKIKVAKDEINLSVSNTYETKSNVESKINTAVSSVQVGGDNVLRNGNFDNGLKNWSIHDLLTTPGTSKSVTVENGGTDWRPLGKKVMEIKGTNTVGRYGAISSTMKLTPNTKYTISGYCAGHRVGSIQVNVRDMINSSANIFTENITPVTGGATLDKWHRFELTFTTTSNSDFALNLYSVNFADNGYVWFCDVQIQQGTKATSWTPCSADTEESINIKANSTDVYSKSEVYTKSQTDSAITVAKDSINLGVSSTYETKKNVETKISTASSSTLSSAKSYADTKKTEAISTASTDATNKVNSAKTELNTAINKKANSTDVYTKSETYTKAQTDSAIKVAKESIELGVKNTYETKTNVESKISSAVSSVQIGGRNLILNSALNGNTNWIGATVDTSKKYGNCNSLKFTGSASAYSSSTPAKVGEVFTVSVKSFVGTSGGNLPLIIFEEYKDNTTTRINYQETTVPSTINSWQTYKATWTVKKSETTNVRIRIYNRTASYNFWVSQPKLEKGNKATDWTPAPEDIDSAIGTKANASDVYKKSETYTKNETDSKISVAKNDITLSVSNTYETKTNVTSKVNTAKTEAVNSAVATSKSYADTKKTEAINSANANTTEKLKSYSTTAQMNSAIQVAKDSITNTVSSTYATKGDVSNTYATKSSLTQTANNITASFKASGGYNLVKNSNFKNGLSGWNTDNIDTAGTSKSITYWTDSNQYILPDTNAVVIKGTNLTERYGVNQTIKIKRGQKYTVSALSASHRGKTIRITIRNSNGGGHLLNVTSTNLAYAGKNISNWNKMEGVFTAPTDSDTITLCLYMDCSANDGYVWFTQLMINEGEVKQPWAPHPDEVYSGSTVIDASGVTINNGALTVKNKAGSTVLSGDSNGNLIFTGTARSQSGAQWVGLDSGGVTFQDSQKNEQILRAGLSYFDSNRDMNGVNFALAQCGDFIRFSHIAKTDLTNGWSPSDTQYNFFDCWSSDQTVGGVAYKKGINVYSPMFVNSGIQLYSDTNYPAEINGNVSWDNGLGVIWNMLGLYGDNGAVLGYKSGSNLHARIVVSEAAHPGTGDHIRSWGNWNCGGFTVHNATFSGRHVNSYANTLTRTVVDTSCIESEIRQVRVIYEDKQLVDGKLILNIPKKYVGNNEGFIVSGIVKKGKGDVWVSEESENRFILEGTDDITVNVEIIIKMPVSSLNTLSCKNESAPITPIIPFKEDVSDLLIK